VRAGSTLPQGTATYKAMCVEIVGTAFNPTKETVYNADIYGWVKRTLYPNSYTIYVHSRGGVHIRRGDTDTSRFFTAWTYCICLASATQK